MKNTRSTHNDTNMITHLNADQQESLQQSLRMIDDAEAKLSTIISRPLGDNDCIVSINGFPLPIAYCITRGQINVKCYSRKLKLFILRNQLSPHSREHCELVRQEATDFLKYDDLYVIDEYAHPN